MFVFYCSNLLVPTAFCYQLSDGSKFPARDCLYDKLIALVIITLGEITSITDLTNPIHYFTGHGDKRKPRATIGTLSIEA